MTRLAAVGTAAFFAAIVLPRASLPLVDGDAWWHIHAGEEILATGRVPIENTWTIAGDGFAWTSQDWLSNVGMAALFDAGPWGATLLSLAFGAAVVAGFALLWSAIGARNPGVGWLARFGWLTAGLIVAGPIIGVRVQTLDLPLAAAVAWILWRYLAEPTPMRAALLIPVAALWVNLHAGWVMLFLLGGAVVVGEAVDRLLSRPLPRPPLAWAEIGLLSGVLALAAGALVLNPNGTDIYAYPFETASIAAHRDFLTEWSPPNLASFEGQVAVAAVIGLVLPTLVLGHRTLRAADALWLVGLAVMTLSAVRFALFLGPLAAALAVVHLGPLVSRSRVGRAIEPMLARWERPPATPRLRNVNGALLVLVLALGIGIAVARTSPPAQAAAIAEASPTRAADWIADEHPAARILNTYAWGGYLARELPRAKVYIDGRSDIYGDAVIREYASAINVTGDPALLLDRDRIDLVLLYPGAPLNAWLAERDEWERAYDDGMAIGWVRIG